MTTEHYALTPSEALSQLSSDERGLSAAEARERLTRYGNNVLVAGKTISPLSIFVSQFKDVLTLILIFAALVSLLLGDLSDAVLITLILVGNAVLGFVQEYKAEQSLAALRQYLTLETTVLRDGEKVRISAEGIVPGDVILLEAGDSVPADARLLAAETVSVDESMLTGESLPVEKSAATLEGTRLLAEQENMVFMGTDLIRGSARAVVTATGMHTQIGSIATLIGTQEETYFQKKLDSLGKLLGKAVVVIALVVMVLGIYENEPVLDMVLIALSLAVAAIPEGLPAVVTITLSLGVRKMAQLKAVVKRLPAAETLGSCTVICSDKTGTITKNMMTVRTFLLPGGEVPAAEAYASDPLVSLLLAAGARANTAQREGRIGDPTELALLDIAHEKGVRGPLPLEGIIPFDSERKRMSVVCRTEAGLVQYCKGAPEQVLVVCDRIADRDGVRPLSEADRARILSHNDAFADRALRVLACAYRDVDRADVPEEHLVFIGLQAMIDPPKGGVAEAVRTCLGAGIKVIMITGDHARTARAIAAEVGIYSEGDLVLTGHDVESLSVEELSAVVERVSVFARVNPEHKLHIVQALRSRGHVIAMTGDGVNDAPALKNADIGIAMNSGTDVSKEAADMLLLDDNFTTIVASVEEGRHIYDNIRKFVRYLLSTNIGEVLTIFLASIVGFPLPLVAVQILWINLLTDGLPALSLAFEPRERHAMHRPPRNPHENIVDRPMMMTIGYIGLAMAIGTLALYDAAPAGTGMTVAFTVLVLYQLVNVFNCRSFSESAFSAGKNIYLWAAVGLSLALQLCVVYLGPLNGIFYTVPLGAREWAMMIPAALSLLLLEEARKAFMRHRSQST